MTLLLNAGLALDVHHLDEAGAEGIGLFRTEFQFMVSETLPRLESQTLLYRDVLERRAAPGHLPHPRSRRRQGAAVRDGRARREPGLGWRAVRIGLDRPALLRYQLRALISAAAAGACA
jgi:phosphotransferase system enzyme I (PtsP)